MINKYRLAVTACMVAALAGCSGSAERRRQASGDFEYLNTEPLQTWNVPSDAKVVQTNNYAIPAGSYNGALGGDVDIRPPQQVLALIPGAKSRVDADSVTLQLAKPEELSRLWQLTQDVVAKREVQLRSQTANRIDTDWMGWMAEDEDEEVASRYSIQKSDADNSFTLALTGWQKAGVEQEISQLEKTRYNVLMTNLLMARYDIEERERIRLRAQELVKQIPISMGQDRSGLPVIIARAPYNVFWERLPTLLDKIGFEVEERNRSQGELKVEFKSPDDELWTELGTQPLQLDNRKYFLQLGDLGNRTSISVTDGDGKPITEQALQSMAPVIAAAIDKANAQ